MILEALIISLFHFFVADVSVGSQVGIVLQLPFDEHFVVVNRDPLEGL